MVPEHHSLSQPFYVQDPADSSSPWLPAQHAKAAPKTKEKVWVEQAHWCFSSFKFDTG